MLKKRELLIKKATELFAQGGYHAIGVDMVVAEAGVAKMTLYKHFPSKDALVVEVLKQRDSVFRSSLTAYVGQFELLQDKIKAVFVWHDKWFRRRDFRGCMFINAAAEFHNRQDNIHKASARHKQLLTAYIESLLDPDTTPQKRKKLATQITILLDGAIVAAHVTRNLNAAMDAWEVAQQLIATN